MELSELAKKVLSSGSDRIGAKRLLPEGPVRRELLAANLIGKNNGLTVKGSIAAERIKNRLEEELFG